MHYKRVLAGDRSELGRTESRFKSHSNWEKNWEELGFFDKLKFFDFWFIVIVAGNFFQVFGAVVSLLEELITADIAIFEHK